MNDITRLIMKQLRVNADEALKVQEILNEPGRIDFSEASHAEIVAEIEDAYDELVIARAFYRSTPA